MPTDPRSSPWRTARTAASWLSVAPNGLSPKIDLGKDAHETQVMDVNFDGLVDVVVTTGTEVQTFFALGRFAKGDGQFGAGSWTSAASANLSPDPVTSCVPWSATPVRFSDSDIQIADMNGDGIPDIVRVRKGDVRYWPGRGNGFWGTGKRDDCPSGTYGDGRHVAMSTSPQFSDIQGDSLRLDDVNGDGLTDLVQVRFDEVDLWLNIDGIAWTDRHVIKNTPASPNYANRVRLVDVNGSGTRDILWGDAGSYKYMDLQGGERPWVLTHIDNGLGKTTTIEYSTSTSVVVHRSYPGQVSKNPSARRGSDGGSAGRGWRSRRGRGSPRRSRRGNHPPSAARAWSPAQPRATLGSLGAARSQAASQSSTTGSSRKAPR